MSKKNRRFSHRVFRLTLAGEGVTDFLAALGGKDRLHLTALWEHWPVVMGEELSSLGRPMGHKDDILIIGADDSMAMQELSLQSGEILERVNAFMDREFFRRIKVMLVQGQPTLDQKRPVRPSFRVRPPLPPRPARLGSLRGTLNPESPVTLCYEAYLAMYSL